MVHSARKVNKLDVRGTRDGEGRLHWEPDVGNSSILAVAGVSLHGGVAARGAMVDAAACLGWREDLDHVDAGDPGDCLHLTRDERGDRHDTYALRSERPD